MTLMQGVATATALGSGHTCLPAQPHLLLQPQCTSHSAMPSSRSATAPYHHICHTHPLPWRLTETHRQSAATPGSSTADGSSQSDRAPWGSQPLSRPYQSPSSLLKRSSAIRSARRLSCNRLRCLPPVPTPFAMRIPCSRSSASSRRNARAVAMLRAVRSSIAAFSASRVAGLQAAALSLAMIAALASAAASARCTRLCHARCSVHAAACACLHDGRKLCGEGGSTGRGVGKCAVVNDSGSVDCG